MTPLLCFLYINTLCSNDPALSRYHELLEQSPKLKRAEEWNDYRKGTYEILYDPDQIKSVQKECYQRWYSKLLRDGVEKTEAHEMAEQWAKPGVVFEDHFFLVIRDVVISPSSFRHTYDRVIWRTELSNDRDAGAAVLPIILDQGVKKIALQIAFRHATNSWEFEIPRGGSNIGETAEQTAIRELKEETGFEIENIKFLGKMTPDSGLLSASVPVFAGFVSNRCKSDHEETEAIGDIHIFSISEIEDALKIGYITSDINSTKTQIPLRDSFTVYALLLSKLHGLLEAD